MVLGFSLLGDRKFPGKFKVAEMRPVLDFNSLVVGLQGEEAGPSAWRPLLWPRIELIGIGLSHPWLGEEDREEFKSN